MTDEKLFNKLLIFGNLYHHTKNDTVSSICYEEMLDLKIPQSEWLIAFWPVSQKQHFFQIEDLYRNTANKTNFHYRFHFHYNSGKINDKNYL